MIKIFAIFVFAFYPKFRAFYFQRYTINVGGRYFNFSTSVPYNTWAHVAMVYRGPNVGEGIVAYKDGIRLGDNTQGNSYQGDVNYDSGEIMIGRLFKEPGIGQFGKCEVDELLIWNKGLESYKIQKIYQMAAHYEV